MLHRNPTEPAIELNIANETYSLFFSFEAIARAEEAAGMPLIVGLKKRDIEAPRVSLVRAMLYGCLIERQPEITYNQAAALVTQHTIHEIWNKILQAWMESTRELKEGNPQ